MTGALVFRSLRQHAPLLGVLSGGLILFECGVVWVAARIDMGANFRQFMGTLLPPGVVETIFGQFGFSTFQGAISFGFQHPMTLVAGIAMVTVMATIPAQEREEGLLDLFLARPLSRSRYLGAALASMASAAALPPLALLAGAACGLAVVDAPEPVLWTAYLPAAYLLFLLLMAVGGYAFLFATGARRRGVAVAQTVAVTLLFYWLDFMGEYWDLLETARAISPFYYFDPAAATNAGLDGTHAAVLAAIMAVTLVGGFVHFNRQNLT